MPELPEIFTIVAGIQKRIIGKIIKSVEVRVPKIVGGDVSLFKKGVLGAEIKFVRRFSKIIVLDLSNSNSILIHLKMTGQLVYAGPGKVGQIEIEKGGHPSKVYEQPLPHNYTHVIFDFSDGSHLYFNDIRKFGYVKLVKTADVEERPEIKNLGAEPLDGWSYNEFLEKLNRRPRSKIKQVLMDQKFVSGIGNIYANEILFYARIRPDRMVYDLSEEEKKKIYDGIKFILKKAIVMGGSSDNTYVDLEGKKGKFMEYAKVYRKKICQVCKGEIKRIVIGGRGTFYCPSCQK